MIYHLVAQLTLSKFLRLISVFQLHLFLFNKHPGLGRKGQVLYHLVYEGTTASEASSTITEAVWQHSSGHP